MLRENVGTQQKALTINLDPSKYGTFAEIGAGQEVVRWFFQVGGAAGTIAKSMSAYDMTVSDAIYGTSERYVSRGRLQAMLDYEFRLLVERLDGKRGAETDFFVFADTVAARNFKGTNECHGWLGVQFQTSPRAEPSQVMIHVRMLDKDNQAQQQALGIVGVNLIHGALYHYRHPENLLEELQDGLSLERIEVDMIRFSGPAFTRVDHRLMSLKMVRAGLTNAVMFAASGEILQPSEVLYKKPVLVERGSFRPVTHVNLDMLECARQQFVSDPHVAESELVTLMEITMKNLLSTADDDGELDYADFLARVDLLAASGATVLVSNYFEYYRLAAYLSRYTKQRIAITMGVPSLMELFEERYYENLEGGILEAFGRLFKNDLRLYIYPMRDRQTGELIPLQKMTVEPHLHNLCEHVIENEQVVSLDCYNESYLPIFSRDCLAKIKAGDLDWETMVPEEVAALIKERCFFGYTK